MRYRDGNSDVHATTYKTPFDDSGFATNFFSRIITSFGQQRDLTAYTDFAQYSKVTYLVPNYNDSGSCLNCDGDVLGAMMDTAVSPSLSVYFNTYYNILQSFSGNTSEDQLIIPGKGIEGVLDPIVVKGAFYDQGYNIYWGWIWIDFISCFILLAAAVASLRLRTRTLIPDIFGYVSSLTRDNPNLDLPDYGSHLSGIDRAKLLNNLKIKVGDVHVDRDFIPDIGKAVPIGKIGIARAGFERPRVQDVRSNRAYL